MINLKLIYMNKLIIILSLFSIACSGNVSQKEGTEKAGHETHNTNLRPAGKLQLNNLAKWKTDEATRANVAAMITLINDRGNSSEKNKEEFTNLLQARIDSLVQQCKMTGPDHDALHMWLEQVLHDMKTMKEGNGDYQTIYGALKKDVESFYFYFE
jgi:hypothetical protein